MTEGSDKTLELLFEVEKVADAILNNKKKVTDLSQRKEDVREAIREALKSEESSIWISVAGIIVKLKRERALALLKKDQLTLETEITALRDENRLLVKRHRDLEQETPLRGFDLRPLSAQESAALSGNLPNF